MRTSRTSSSLPETRFELDRFLSLVRESPRSALLLDYDGTLAPFTIDRGKAFPYPGVVPCLQEIMASGRTRLVVITGRDARDAVKLLGIHPAPEVWGSHGLQRLKADGACQMPAIDEAARQALSEAAKLLERLNVQCLAEFKPGGIAVHWRALAGARAAQIREQVLRGWFPIAQQAQLSVLEFDGGVEIRLSDFDKGDAVRVLLREMGPDVPVAYLGDDTTDEHAFEALTARGLTVLVRPEWRQTAAQLWLKPPQGLLDFLERWGQQPGRRGEVCDDNQLQPMGGR